MTPIETKLNELEKLDKAATPVPWKFERVGWDEGHFTYEMNDKNMFLAISELDYTDDNGKPQPMMAKFNSQLIAAYRNETPKLIQALRDTVEVLENIGAVALPEKDIRACGGDAFVSDAMLAREALTRIERILGETK